MIKIMLIAVLSALLCVSCKPSDDPKKEDKGGCVEINVDDVKFQMIKVNGGTFTMGATKEQRDYSYPQESPTHEVTLSDYYIGETEVTQALWRAVTGKNPSYHKGDDLPVDNVTWNDCQNFIKLLNEKTGKNFRLPTEAEWEYAARGGSKTHSYIFSGSNNQNDIWYYDNSDATTHKVASKPANELGIYDMSGNVYEWCADWYGDYTSEAQVNPQGPNSGSLRVLRGGSYSVIYRYSRISHRSCGTPIGCNTDFGLRLAL